MAALFGCGQEGFSAGRSCGGGERGFGAFYRSAEEGSDQGRRLTEWKPAVVPYQEEAGYGRGGDRTGCRCGKRRG
jgi:hypothetical protein